MINKPIKKRKEGIIPSRIKEARISRGYSLQDLSEKIGVSSQALSQYELGSIKPQADVLMRLIQVLNFPLNFFKKPKNNDNNSSNSAVYFRSMKSTTKKLKEAYACRVGWINEIYKYLEKYIDFPRLNLPDLNTILDNNYISKTKIEEIALLIRNHWSIGNNPIYRLSELLEENGFVISHIKYNNRKIDAFSQWFENVPYILLGNETSSVRWRFDLAHELGHLVLHQHITKEDLRSKEILDTIEEEANYFAGAFLLPIDSFSSEIFSSSLTQFVLIKEKWQVSIVAMIKRAQHLNLVSDNQVRYLFSQISVNKYWKKEPLDDEIPYEKPYLLKQAVELLINENVMSVNQLLDEIPYSKNEIEELLFLPKEVLERKKNKIDIKIKQQKKNGKLLS